MNAGQIAKLNMYNAVINQLKNENAALDHLPALRRNFNLFAAKVAAINSLTALQKEGSRGETLTKEQVRQMLVAETLTVSAQVAAWASETNNIKVEQAADLTLSDLDREKDSLLPGQAQALHNLAEDNKADLAEYGVTDQSLETLKHAIEDFTKVVASPRNKIVSRSTVSKNVVNLFKEADKVLNDQVKKLLGSIKTKFPDVNTAFISNAKIVDAPSAKSTAKKAGSYRTKVSANVHLHSAVESVFYSHLYSK